MFYVFKVPIILSLIIVGLVGGLLGPEAAFSVAILAVLEMN